MTNKINESNINNDITNIKIKSTLFNYNIIYTAYIVLYELFIIYEKHQNYVNFDVKFNVKIIAIQGR